MAQGPAMTVRLPGPTEVLDRDTEDGSGMEFFICQLVGFCHSHDFINACGNFQIGTLKL